MAGTSLQYLAAELRPVALSVAVKSLFQTELG